MSFKYQQLGQQLIDQISRGELPPGSALPAIRRLAQRHQVSIATANQTYQWLEQQGFVYAKPQSGFYVKHQPSTRVFSPTSTAVVNVTTDRSDHILQVQQNALYNDNIGLSSGFLAPSLRPIAGLQRALNRHMRRSHDQIHGYGHAQGEPCLRQVIAEHMRYHHASVDPEQILVTNGCLEAITLAINTLTETGDVIAVFSPCYSGLLTAIQYAGRKIIEIPCGPNGPDFDVITTLMKHRACAALLLSATATNPLGFTLSAQQKQQLAKLAAEHQTWIIEDDTFGCLHYNDSHPSPVYAYEHDGYVVYCSSFSKELAPNLRIGWLASRKNISGFCKRKLALNLTCAMPSQLALADYLSQSSYKSYIKTLRATLQTEMNQLQRAVANHFPKETRMSAPQGGFMLWVQLPEAFSGMELFHHAKEQGIIIMPGEIFTMTSLYKNCIRLSANQTWNTQREQAIAWIGGYLTQRASTGSVNGKQT